MIKTHEDIITKTILQAVFLGQGLSKYIYLQFKGDRQQILVARNIYMSEKKVKTKYWYKKLFSCSSIQWNKLFIKNDAKAVELRMQNDCGVFIS